MPYTRRPVSAAFAQTLALLQTARTLQRAQNAHAPIRQMRGMHVCLVCEATDSPSARRFIAAALSQQALVSHLQPSRFRQSEGAQPQRQGMARMLNRLYEVVECQGDDAQWLRRLAGRGFIPVFDGLGTPEHPVARLVCMLEGEESDSEKWRLLIEAALLLSIA